MESQRRKSSATKWKSIGFALFSKHRYPNGWCDAVWKEEKMNERTINKRFARFVQNKSTTIQFSLSLHVFVSNGIKRWFSNYFFLLLLLFSLESKQLKFQLLTQYLFFPFAINCSPLWTMPGKMWTMKTNRNLNRHIAKRASLRSVVLKIR